MATPIFTLSPEMQQTWDYVMGQMLSFVNDTNADVDMAYDFVCEQLDIDSFVDNEAAWNDFYTYWEAADNRNQTQYNLSDLSFFIHTFSCVFSLLQLSSFWVPIFSSICWILTWWM